MLHLCDGVRLCGVLCWRSVVSGPEASPLCRRSSCRLSVWNVLGRCSVERHSGRHHQRECRLQEDVPSGAQALHRHRLSADIHEHCRIPFLCRHPWLSTSTWRFLWRFLWRFWRWFSVEFSELREWSRLSIARAHTTVGQPFS